MSVYRLGATATALTNGTVLVAGGKSISGEVYASAELYNPSVQTFTLTGSMSSARNGATAALKNDGQVLVAGGGNASGTLPTAELYNPTSGAFSLTGRMTTARSGAQPTVLNTQWYNQVLIAGGEGSSGEAISAAEIYTGASVTGIINPKYVILGVIYAPPGPQSSVTYGASTYVGNKTSLSSSFSNESSVTVSIGAPISGWGPGKILGTSTTAYTQTSGSSSSAEIDQSTSQQNKYTGTGNAFSPVDHDYDQIVLWLNPVLPMTVTPGSQVKIQWNGYGYDSADQPGMDIYPVFVGYLNGDFGPNASVAAVLARSWAKNQTWPSGEGPGLTAADLANVMAADPFSNPNYTFTLESGVSPATSADGRFTIATTNPTYNQTSDFPYTQCGPGGGGCNSEAYSNGYTYTSTQGQSAMYQLKQAFGMEQQFSGTVFGIDITGSVSESQTLTWQAQWQNVITNTQAETDQLTIQGPSCTGDPCNPSYSGPPEFDVYEDNVYGTFVFIPVN